MSPDIQNFLEKVNEELKFEEYRERFIEELRDHVDDGVHERELQGIKEGEACQQILAQLGKIKQLSSLYNFVIMDLKNPWNSIKKIIFAVGLVVIILVSGFTVTLYADTFISTKYSSNYSFLKFNSLKIGMAKDEVVKIIGEPLDKRIFEDREFWYYSTLTSKGIISDGNWQMRIVEFRNNKATEITREIYWD